MSCFRLPVVPASLVLSTEAPATHMLSKCSQSCRLLPSMVWCPIPCCCNPNFPVLESWWHLPGMGFLYSRKYTIDRRCCIKDKNAYLLCGAIQLSLGKFCMQNFRLSLYASTAMVLGVLLTDIVAEQILSSIAGQTPCSIMCYLVRIEKALSLLSHQANVGTSANSTWADLKLTVSICAGLGWFCLQSCKLAGDPLLEPTDWEETGVVSTGFVQRLSLACERDNSTVSKHIFQSAQGRNALYVSVLLELPNSDFSFLIDAEQENDIPKSGCWVWLIQAGLCSID